MRLAGVPLYRHECPVTNALLFSGAKSALWFNRRGTPVQKKDRTSISGDAVLFAVYAWLSP